MAPSEVVSAVAELTIHSDCCRPAVGAGCIIAAGADIGDKTSVKRSVIGPGCVLGSNVKVRAASCKLHET